MVELRGTLLSNSTSFIYIYVILLIGNLLIPMILLLILMLLFTFQKLLWKSKKKRLDMITVKDQNLVVMSHFMLILI